MMQTVPRQVEEMARRHPARIAFVHDGRRTDYGQWWRMVLGIAGAFAQAGLQRGERVAIVLPNCAESAAACFGAWLCGAIAVPMNAQARSRDFDAWLRHCGARMAVHDADNIDIARSLRELDGVVHAWPVRPGEGLPQVDADCAGSAAIALDDQAMILYTSGTTGQPKGVTLGHSQLAANTAAILDYLRIDAGDSVLTPLPFYYSYGLSVLLTHLAVGARIVLAPSAVFPQPLVEAIASERVTGFSAVPSMFALVCAKTRLDGLDFSALRYLTQAGGAMSAALTTQLRAAFPGAALFAMYGQTEATSRLTWLPPERLDDKAGSVGIPVRGVRLKIADEDGNPLPPGMHGEVLAQGPALMRGYWNDPQASAAAVRDGWLHTGDIGWLDQDGFLFLCGRRSDMIKTGAHRVHPQDIEDVILEVHGVEEAAVTGIDDEVLGQAVVAHVVGRFPGAPLETAIRRHCRERLAPYKVPRQVRFVQALPRTASGKLRRAALGAN